MNHGLVGFFADFSDFVDGIRRVSRAYSSRMVSIVKSAGFKNEFSAKVTNEKRRPYSRRRLQIIMWFFQKLAFTKSDQSVLNPKNP
jgi:hypothetical protein